MNESVSVVIPAYQAASFIEDALQSVAAQTRTVQRIVVVDDGSTDGTSGVVTAWSDQHAVEVMLIKQANGGAGSARKVGLQNTVSDLIMFLDADDRLRPAGVALLHQALNEAPSALVAYGAMRTFVDDRQGESAANKAVLATGPVMLPSSTIIRRGAFGQIGHFGDDNFSAVDWFARIIELGPTASVSIPDVVVERRIHAANTSTTTKSSLGEYARMVKASLDRRRAAGSK